MKILLLILAFIAGVTYGLFYSKPVSYVQKTALAFEEAPLASPTPSPITTDVIVAEIARVFEPEGKHVVVQAINCFYSESGLRAEAINDKNTNGTTDAGVAQINDVHKMSVKDRLDYKKNIAKAYQIYKGRGSNWSAWYGKLCN